MLGGYNLNVDSKNLCAFCFEELSDNAALCQFCGISAENQGEPTSNLPVRTILLGKFIIGKVLGKGGFGITYLAYDLSRDCKVAIKEYMPDTLSYRTPGKTLVSTYMGEKEESFKLGSEKFYEEAKTISKFNGHPNIINVYEFFYQNNTAYFVMEYIDGMDLKKYIMQKGGNIPEDECINLLTPIMDALIIVHSIGILHRDISPDNIYITNDGNVKLLDFGAARQVLGEKSKSLSVVLKPGFAPIEQYQTRGKQGEWTDIYSLAATMYYCLAGQIPEAAMDRIEEDNIKPLSELNDKVSKKVVQILKKALSVKGIDRYQTVAEFKQAFANEKATLYKSEFQNSNESLIQPRTLTSDKSTNRLNRKAFISIIAASIIVVCSVVVYGVYKISNNTTATATGNNGSVVLNGLNISAVNTNAAVATQANAQKDNDAAIDKSTSSDAATDQSTSKDIAKTTDKNTNIIDSKNSDLKAEPSATTQSNTTKNQDVNIAKDTQTSEATSSQIASSPSERVVATQSQTSPADTKDNADQTIDVEKQEYTYVTKKFSVDCTYTGKWKDNKPNGYGKLTMIQDVSPYWEVGDELFGTFENGLLNYYSVYKGISGGFYYGSFKNGLKDGFGTFTYSDGSKYEGDFKEGEFNGQGTYTDQNGEVWKGNWENGEFKS